MASVAFASASTATNRGGRYLWRARGCGRLLTSLALLVALTAHVAHNQRQVEARYVPYGQRGHRQLSSFFGGGPQRRQDYDGDSTGGDGEEEDMDQNASSPNNRNHQEHGGNGQASDGYDDNEPDGPYEETPREQEGQADLERFFDDHLGASERDGMDKENLPTNLVTQLAEPNHQEQATTTTERLASPSGRANEESSREYPALTGWVAEVAGKERWRPNSPATPTWKSSTQQPGESLAHTIEQAARVTRLPERRKLIITTQREITTQRNAVAGPTFAAAAAAAADSGEPSNGAEAEDEQHQHQIFMNGILGHLLATRQKGQRQQQQHQLKVPTIGPQTATASADSMDATGSDIVVREDDDFDKVYVTNATHKPFKIDALGGYDPEEDFDDASRDIEESAATKFEPTRRGGSTTANANCGEQQRSCRSRSDAAPTSSSFGESEATDEPYEDAASETDEITFGQDDPYQTDLEAEMRQQAFEKIGNFNAEPRRQAERQVDDGSTHSERPRKRPAGRRSQSSATSRRNEEETERPSEDTDEGGWVNDGIDDMDIPSQSRQNVILDRAAQAEALARRTAEDVEAPETPATQAANDEAIQQQQQQESAPATDEAEQAAAEPDEEGSQRMPNADYMRNDFNEDENL